MLFLFFERHEWKRFYAINSQEVLLHSDELHISSRDRHHSRAEAALRKLGRVEEDMVSTSEFLKFLSEK